jgi:C-terminal processing protease CtpA/Prc
MMLTRKFNVQGLTPDDLYNLICSSKGNAITLTLIEIGSNEVATVTFTVASISPDRANPTSGYTNDGRTVNIYTDVDGPVVVLPN